MTQSSTQPTQQFRGKLTRTSLLFLLPLALVPVAILGVVNLYNTYNFLQKQAIAQFISVGDKQSELINNIVKDRESFLLTLSKDSTFRSSLDAMLESDLEGEDFQRARGGILSNYDRIHRTQNENFFIYFLVVSPDEKILVSTYPLWEGKIMDQSTYDELLFKSTSVALFNIYPFHTEEFTNQFLVFSSQRVYDSFGNHTGTIIGITNPTTFQSILELGTLSYAEARPYYITKPQSEGVFVGLSPEAEDLVIFEPSYDHMEKVLPKILSDDKEGVLEFASFNDEPVLAYVKWLPSIEAGLVIEAPQAVIIDPLGASVYPQITLLAISLLILSLAIWQGTKRIVQPILQVSATAQQFADGDMQARALVNRKDEIGLLAYSFNHVANELASIYHSMESMVKSRTQQIQTASEVAQVVTSATSLEEMLAYTANLITERFNYYHTAIYLMGRGGDNLILREAAGQAAQDYMQLGLRIEVGSRSIVGNVAATNKPWVADDVKRDPYYLELESLPETQSEAAIPLSVGGRVLGVLDVQSNELKAFDDQDITTLQTLAGQIASAIQNVRLLENAQIDLQSSNLLYQTSHRLANVETSIGIFQTLAEILQNTPYISRVFSLESGMLHSVEISSASGSLQYPGIRIPISKGEIEQILQEYSWQAIPTDNPPSSLPKNLTEVAREIDCQVFVLIPLISREQLSGIILMGAAAESMLTSSNLEPYYSVAQMANTALEKIEASNRITASFAELQSLSALSQAISTEIDLAKLFETLHRQVVQTVGDVNFLIALYDAETELIEIPYMTEDDQIISIPTFPLGQGLTSIVIRTQQPLMIVEDTVNRTRALGAIVTSGKMAQSWLGVPLLVAGEVVGAVAVQDLENEHRFDEDDLRLLTTLAGQVAPTVRNARLLAITQEAAERDRRLYEITNNIRRATSIPEILEMTTRELGQVLDLKKAKIEISIDPTRLKDRDNGKEEKSE